MTFDQNKLKTLSLVACWTHCASV